LNLLKSLLCIVSSSDQALSLLPPSPEPYDLHLGILAQSYTVNEFRKRFTNYESFFNEQTARYDQVAADNVKSSCTSSCDLFFIETILIFSRHLVFRYARK
jgi:hypothetical protein